MVTMPGLSFEVEYFIHFQGLPKIRMKAAVVVLLLFLLQRMAPDIKMTIGHK